MGSVSGGPKDPPSDDDPTARPGSSPPPPPTLAPTLGRAISEVPWSLRHPLGGRYEVVEVLGQGGMGTVVKARDLRREGRLVAVKLMLAAEPRELVMFKREYRKMERIAHPALVPLYGLEMHDGRPFIVMEYIEGVDFYEGARPSPDAPLSLARLRALLRPLVQGIAELHAWKRIHRDLKGSNVMVAGDRVVILDFGLVNELQRRTLYTSSLGSVTGTPIYMAPEQAAGQMATEASDWYALGVMLFRVTTNRYPFEGYSYGVLNAKQEREPPRAADIEPAVPPALDELIARLLQREPAQRASAIDVLTWCDHQPTPRPRAPRPPPARDEPLIDREPQLAALASARARWLSRVPLRVDIAGGPGTGKTALLRRFVDSLLRSDPDVVILEGACHEFDAVPIKAFDGIVDALARFLRKQPREWVVSLLDDGARALERFFPVLAGLRGPDGAEELKRRLGLVEAELGAQELRQRAFRGLRNLLHRIAVERRLVLAVDDLHWGDVDSARLLCDLLAPPGAPPLLFVCTYLDEAGAPASAGAPILRELAALQAASTRQHEAVLVRTDALSDAGGAALALRLLGGGEADRVRARAIAAEAQNNPVLIEACVRHLGDVAVEDMTRMTLVRRQLSLAALLARRLGSLDPTARAVLELVAVAGQPIEEVLVAAAVADAGDLRAVFAQLRGNHLLRSCRVGEVDAACVYHPRIGHAVRERLLPSVLCERHRQLAEAIVAAGRGEPHRIAHHWFHAGELERAAEAAIEAAQAARAIGSFDSACQLLWLAQRCRPGDPALISMLAETLTVAGRLAEAAPLLLAAAERGRPSRSTRALRRRAAEVWLAIGETARGLEAMRPLLREFELDYPEQDHAALSRRKATIQRLGQRGLAFVEQSPMLLSGRDLERADVCMSLCRGHMLHDPVRGGLFAAESALRALELGEPRRIVPALALAGVAAFERDPALAQRWIDEAERLAEAIHDGEGQAIVSICSGIVQRIRGVWGQASSELEYGLQSLPADAMWERSLAAASLLASLEALGEFTTLALRSQQFAQLAQGTADRRMYGLAVLYSALIALAQDDVARCERRIAEALAAFGDGEYQIVHLYALKLAVERDLYAGEPERAWARIEADWPRIDRSAVMQAEVRRFVALALRARAGLALWASGRGPARLPGIVESDVAQVRRERAVHAQAFAELLAAGVAALQRDEATVRERLATAVASFDYAGMAVHATCVRRYQALWGGDPGRLQLADNFLRMQGIARPERWCEVLAPALARRCSGVRGAVDRAPDPLRPAGEIGDRRAALVGGLRQFGDPPPEPLLAEPQATAHGPLGDGEQLGDLGPRQLLDDVELERDLLVERELAQGGDEQQLLAPPAHDRGHRRREVVHAHLGEVGRLALVLALLADVTPQHVAGDPVQIGAKGRVLADPVLALDAGLEGLVGAVLGLGRARDLVGEEAPDRGIVTVDQGPTCRRIAAPPALEQLGVGVHGGPISRGLGRGQGRPDA